MSCTSKTKSSEVSESDSSETNYSSRGHPYNTRYSNKNCYVKKPQTKKNLNKSTGDSNCVPKYNFEKKTGDYEEENDSSMDYCFDDPCQVRPLSTRRSILSWCLRGIFYLFLFGGIGYVIYSQYLIECEFQKIRDDVLKMRGRNKKDDKIKSLDKKCRDALKVLLKDAVGRPDYALGSSGGRVISVTATPFSDTKTFLGFHLCESDHGPSLMIQATTSPGECWAFQGNTGRAVIQLIDEVLVDSVTLEHIPSTLSPSGSIDTAPKDFTLWGEETAHGKRIKLGEFKYDAEGDSIQTFDVKNDLDRYYKYVEFEVTTNHGNKDFTCVYRLRVHGSPKKK